MSKDEMEAAFLLLAAAAAAFDKSSRGMCAETHALAHQARETLNLKTWRPPTNIVQLAAVGQPAVAVRKEG